MNRKLENRGQKTENTCPPKVGRRRFPNPQSPLIPPLEIWKISGTLVLEILANFSGLKSEHGDKSPLYVFGKNKGGQSVIRTPHSSKGVVLVFTLIMIAVLSALTINLSSRMNQEVLLLKNSSDELKASSLAQAGTQYAIAILKMDDDFQADWLAEGWAEEVILTFDEGTVKINTIDEGGKINLNYLNTGKEREKKLKIEQMLELCDNIGLDYAIIPAIIDWLDADYEISELLSITVGENKGAESDYYEDLPIPYPCKNASFDITQELMMVRGIEKENYYGQNGLENFITVFAGGKININTAGKEVLKATLQASLSSFEENQPEILELIDDIAVTSIMDWRIDNPFYDLSSLGEFFSEDVVNKILQSQLFDVKSNVFTITSNAKVGKIDKNITVVVERN
ncbi:MAG: general secretion pathway protein GspK, partial [Candidatus Omnitrophica bacterium]|nr:general secretion pathway protein GspK [Candidatus Omnitrophota bacterium]